MSGLAGYTFDWILERTCFWPQTDQEHFFSAAAQKIATEIFRQHEAWWWEWWQASFFVKYWDCCSATAIVIVPSKISVKKKKRKIWKGQLWVRPIESLTLIFARCVIHQTRSLGYSSLHRRKPWHRAKKFVGVKFHVHQLSLVMFLTCKYSLHWSNQSKIDVIGKQWRYYCWHRSESVRQRSSSYFTALQTNPTAAQKPTAAECNNTPVRRHIRGVVSDITIRHRGQAELAVRAHLARLHRTITNGHKRKAKTLSAVLLCQLLCWRQQRAFQ